MTAGRQHEFGVNSGDGGFDGLAVFPDLYRDENWANNEEHDSKAEEQHYYDNYGSSGWGNIAPAPGGSIYSLNKLAFYITY